LIILCLDITVDGINRSLDLIDSVFIQNEDPQVVLSPLALEFELPTPIFEVFPGFDCQFPQGATLTDLNNVYDYSESITITPPPFLPIMTPPTQMESISTMEPSRPPQPSSAIGQTSLAAQSSAQFVVPSTSTGNVYHDPPPQRNFFCDSNDSDIQMDHFGRAIRTRSQTSSVTSSVRSSTVPTTHKVQCDTCHKWYTKYYLRRHMLIHNK
jgi:hypothetical protein